MVNYSVYAIKNIHTGKFYKTDQLANTPVYVDHWFRATLHHMTEVRAQDWLQAVKEIFDMENDDSLQLFKITLVKMEQV